MSEIEQTQSHMKGIISSSNGLKVSDNREVPNIDNQPPLDNLHTLKHKELKELCKSKGLKVSGNKDVLLGRLRESFRNGEQKTSTPRKKRAPRTPLQLEVVKMKSSNYRLKDRYEAKTFDITQKEVRDRRRDEKRAVREQKKPTAPRNEMDLEQINTQLEKARANDLDEEQFEPLIKALEEAGREQETKEVLKLHIKTLKKTIQRDREQQVHQQIQQQFQQQFQQFQQQVQLQIQHQVQQQVQQQFQQQAEQ